MGIRKEVFWKGLIIYEEKYYTIALVIPMDKGVRLIN